jgi:two-component system chemotaxis sensor kinase CheA
MALDMVKFLARFVEEAREHVSRLNEGLVKLEKDPHDKETVDAVFRSAHTIKGSSRMMKLVPISEVAHKLEDALAAVRDGKIRHSKELADALFKGTDYIAGLVEKTASGQLLDIDTGDICRELSLAAGEIPLLSSSQAAAGETAAKLPNSGKHSSKGEGPDRTEQPPIPASPGGQHVAETIRVDARKLDVLIRLMGEIVSNQHRLKHRLAEVKEAQRLAKRKSGLLARSEEEGPSGGALPRELFATSQALSGKINQLARDMRDDATVQELLTAELQEKALMMRMVPLGEVFDPLHRLTRDFARSQKKEIDFIVKGADIGLDKKMMEKIGDPIVHMLRNAIDHGIESPEERRKAGKPERGRITLTASYDAGSVVIELRDDGSGIALEKIRERAIKKKLYSKEELSALSEPELVDLIFLPGFSTSALITDLSGRGVGMDVVKRNFVEELKGSIRVDTGSGKGTCFTIRLPMTLAVMRVLLVQAGGMTFAVTTHYVGEIVRVPASEIIAVLDRRAIRLREELISVKSLGELLQCSDGRGPGNKDLLLLVMRVGNEKLGLIVDALLDEEDMVIKSLPSHMTRLPLVAGVTISGKNDVICILNIPGVIAAAKALKETKKSRDVSATRSDAVRILVVDDSMNTRDIEKGILEAYGYEVDLAGDGIEAIERARNYRYDLIVTDIEMPRMDGFSLTEWLRGNETYRDTPIVIVTSREKEEDKKRGIMAGANAYIVKGAFDQTNLLETVQNLV